MLDRIADFVLRLASQIAGRQGWLNETINAFLINRLANAGQNRPHPWTTRSSYIGWASLTDRNYNARLLPPGDLAALPPTAKVAALFAASPDGQRLCRKSTCLFPAFAQYLTDGFIRTQLSNNDDEEDRSRTTSNHEIDLSPLYGRTPAQTRALRRLTQDKGSRGQMRSQMIGIDEYPPFLYQHDGETLDPRFVYPDGTPMLDLPLGVNKPWAVRKTLFACGGDRVNASPLVMMINLLFLREHNRMAKIIETMNSDWDDDRIFETTRNIIIVMFIKIVIEEYINHISTAPFMLRALPNTAWKAKWNRPNWITAEFGLLYRWHSLIPETFQWGTYFLQTSQMTLNNTRLLVDGLLQSFLAASANSATQLGLGNSAAFLVPIEQKAIDQARHIRLASYNDYRAAMRKTRRSHFEDIVGTSDDPVEQRRRLALTDTLKQLYGNPDNLEFYVGLFAEPANRNGPLPELLQAMVAMDAFSQALTNPLLSEHIWGDPKVRSLTFTPDGLRAIEQTTTLRDILARNSKGLKQQFVGMTKPDWHRR